MTPRKEQPPAQAGSHGIEQSLGATAPALHGEALVEEGVVRTSNGKQHHDAASEETLADADGDATHTETSPLLGGSNNDDLPTKTKTSPFRGDISPARFWLIFSQLLLALFIFCFDMTILASSHPVITSYFHASNLASWLSTVPLLTTAIAQPLAGRLSDAVGRKPLFVGGMAVFTLATGWCALAGSIESFIAARAVVGLGGGGAMCLSGVILSDLVKIEYRGSYQAFTNIVFGIGSALGAALWGVMAESLGWRWEFGVQVPPLTLSVCLAYISIPGNVGIEGGTKKTLQQVIREFDSLGAALLTVFISFLILGLNLGGNYLPWSHPFVIFSLVICAVTGPFFILVERRALLPVMPLNLATISPRANILYANFICAILTHGILFNLPLYFQAVLLTSATSSGLRLVLPTAVTSLCGAATGFAINWSGRIKWPVTTGPIFYFFGLIWLSLLQRHLPAIVYHLVLVPTFIGQGMQMPGTFMALLGSSTQEEQAVVTAVLTLWRSLGMVLGVAISSLAVQNGLVHYLNKYVQGERAEEIIHLARSSVESVREMPEPYREQVIRSYDATLRFTFVCGIGLAAVAVFIIAPAKMKRLPSKK